MSEQNPLLKKIQMPGRRFRLPSRGLFYNNGELADSVTDGEIEVRSLTAIDEISLRSPEFLFNGEAIERVFARCVPEVKEPLKLLSLDVDFILTALRVVSYGDVLEVNVRCDECEKSQQEKNIRDEDEFLREVKNKADEQGIPFESALESSEVVNKLERLSNRRAPRHAYPINLLGVLTNQTTEVSKEEIEKYRFELSNGQIVESMPLRMNAAILSYQFQNEDFTQDLDKAEDYVVFILTACIDSVVSDGERIKNKAHIEEWAKNLPIKLKDELAQKMQGVSNWGTDFSYNLTCPDCRHTWNGSTLLNPITFFIAPSDQVEPSN